MLPVSAKKTRYELLPSMTMLPNDPPSMVRSEVIGGSGAPRVIVAGVAGHENVIVLAPPVELANRIVLRKSPTAPGPSPAPAGEPAALGIVSVQVVTGNVAARTSGAAQMQIKARLKGTLRYAMGSGSDHNADYLVADW
jgi:hypothetical protein